MASTREYLDDESRPAYRRTVQYYETDRMGVAHHANYIHWMEEARIDFMDEIGFPYRRMEAEGVLSPVKSLQSSTIVLIVPSPPLYTGA